MKRAGGTAKNTGAAAPKKKAPEPEPEEEQEQNEEAGEEEGQNEAGGEEAEENDQENQEEGDQENQGEEEQQANGDEEEDEPEVSQAKSTYRKRRLSQGNPKIKPRQTEADNTSNLPALAKQNEDKNKKAEEFSDPANQILYAKNSFVNTTIVQHLLSSGFEKSAKELQNELANSHGIKSEKFELAKTKSLKAAFFEHLRQGNEKLFFETRKLLHQELNYYQLDFELSLELEMKTRVYFALYYLIHLEERRLDPEEARRLTKERIESLKSFFVDKGSAFSEDQDLKEYLKIPYLVETMPPNNSLLNFVLSKDFANQIVEQNQKEIERVIFFANEVTRHRSFITKVYEFFVKYHPEASQSELHSQIYDEVESAIETVRNQASKYEEEAAELDGLANRLNQLIQKTLEKYKAIGDSEVAKVKAIATSKLKPIQLVQVNKETKTLNAEYVRKWNQITELIKEIEKLDKELKRAQNPNDPSNIDLSPEGRKLQIEYFEKKRHMILLKLKMILIESKRPVTMNTSKEVKIEDPKTTTSQARPSAAAAKKAPA